MSNISSGRITNFQFPVLNFFVLLCYKKKKNNLSKANYSVGWPGNKLEALKHFHYGD